MKMILLIEDDMRLRRNLQTILSMEGFDVMAAENGRDGLNLAHQTKPDLVLCDIIMPDLDGYEVLDAVRGEPATSTTPFIFLTGKSDRGDMREGMNRGADDYLVKPVDREDVLAAIDARLSRSALERTRGPRGFSPDFSSSRPLCNIFGLTPREGETLLWCAQGKTNFEIATILGMSEKTVKQHLGSIFQKLGVEGRGAAMLRALEILPLLSNAATR